MCKEISRSDVLKLKFWKTKISKLNLDLNILKLKFKYPIPSSFLHSIRNHKFECLFDFSIQKKTYRTLIQEPEIEAVATSDNQDCIDKCTSTYRCVGFAKYRNVFSHGIKRLLYTVASKVWNHSWILGLCIVHPLIVIRFGWNLSYTRVLCSPIYMQNFNQIWSI